MTKNITCTRCPMGCTLTVTEKSGILTVTGQGCPRGEEYGRSEYTCPVRTLTTTVLVTGGAEPLLPVRTDRPIPKDSLFACMELLRSTSVAAPVSAGQVLLEDLAGTGANLIACADR